MNTTSLILIVVQFSFDGPNDESRVSAGGSLPQGKVGIVKMVAYTSSYSEFVFISHKI